MASLEESLLASAMESLNIESYWPTFDSRNVLDVGDDSEYSIILCFYETLLDNLIDRYSVGQADLQAAIKHLVYNYSHVANGKTPEDLDYRRMPNCLGYLHRYAACHTALVHSIMLRVFHACPPAPIRRLLALKDHLNLVFLGGGPGNDYVGVLSALFGKHYGFMSMDVSILDSMEGWIPVFDETSRLLRRGDCGNASKTLADVRIATTYLVADMRLKQSWSGGYKSKLDNADLVFMVKFLSVVPAAEKLTILQNVVTSMKPGSLLVFIDCPMPTTEFAAVKDFLDVVYEAVKEKFEFDFVVERFGYPNITSSRAHVRLYVRKFYIPPPATNN